MGRFSDGRRDSLTAGVTVGDTINSAVPFETRETLVGIAFVPGKRVGGGAGGGVATAAADSADLIR
jgi:hypothetical protein